MPVLARLDPASADIVAVSTGLGVGDLVALTGDVQYGALLLGASVGSELTGWRDIPETSVSDTTRPQAHGAYAGDIWAEAATVTLTYKVPGPPRVPTSSRDTALRLIEANLPLDSIERPLVVNDGDTTFRMARVLQRQVPRPWDFAYSKVLECTVQWLCADPRRYSLTSTDVAVPLPANTGGLTYPLAYPLAYGISQDNTRAATNNGSTATPPVITLVGPLTNPVLIGRASAQTWRLSLALTLAAGETLVVDTARGTVELNGDVDRLYTLDAASSPLERCVLAPGTTTLSLTAAAGTGQATVSYRYAYL